jgi:hypothetical protein
MTDNVVDFYLVVRIDTSVSRILDAIDSNHFEPATALKQIIDQGE